MSKEFEEWWQNKTEGDYALKCYHKDSVEALQAAFTAGRALGRREMKGELGRVVDFLEGQSRRGEIVTANTFRAAIEAIPEEAQ